MSERQQNYFLLVLQVYFALNSEDLECISSKNVIFTFSSVLYSTSRTKCLHVQIFVHVLVNYLNRHMCQLRLLSYQLKDIPYGY